MRRTPNAGLLAGIGMVVALLVINAVVSYRNTWQLNDDAGWVARTQEVRAELAGVLRTLVDAETGYRGFVVTGKDDYLQPYNAALASLPDRLARLKSLTGDNADQRKRLTTLEALSASRLANMKEGIGLRRDKGFQAAQAFVATDEGKRRMDAVRQLVDEMTADEERLLKDREVKTAHAYAVATTTSLVVAALGLLAVGAFVWLFQRHQRSRTRAAAVIHRQRELLRATLASIGDAVIATDAAGRVTFLNSVACELTGWTQAEAEGQPLDVVFRIVNEQTRQEVENPALRALKEGRVVGLANHTVLIAKDGTERPIDDSAAPIRDGGNEVNGAVLVFRDVSQRRQAERALRESEARSRAVLETALDGIITIDHEGKVVEFNPAAERTFGFRRQDVIGRELAELVIPPQLRGRHREGMARYLATGEGPVLNRRIELTAVRADGRVFPVEVAITPIRGDGHPLFTGHLRDITDRKEAEERLRAGERRLRFVMDSMPQKIFTATPSGDVDYFNPQWTEFTGLPFEQIRDWGWTQFIHPDDVGENVRAWKHSVATGEPFQFEHRFRRADGEYRWHLSRAVALKDDGGTVQMWVGSNTDIHEQKETAERLRQLAADLSEADRKKDEFLATLAHELRNPLAPIRNGLQIMRLANGQAATVEQARTMMERQLTQLVRLVDDLMDVSRITRGRLELRTEPVQLAAVVHSAVEASRPLIEEMGHELTVTLPRQPVVVDADLTRLAQVFSNLLTNAAKYTDRGGRITLTAERQGSDAVVSVKDTGIGIPADKLTSIFEMFSQVDRSLEKSQGGLGIGLTLVRRLVEMHGGRVEARSEGPGKGSEFLIRLPVVVEASGTQPGGEEPVAVKSSLRILIVDDNRDAADSLAMMLAVLGNDTRTANDGQEGVAVAEEFRPDVVLLDIGLPKLNGYEACRRIRGQPWGKDVVLIAVTGWGQEEDRRRSQEAGFDHHMVKPVDPQALMKLLAGLRATTG